MSSPAIYVRTLLALLALLAVTVGVAYLDLGPLNTAVAMLISLAKAALIILFFMHGKQAPPLLRIFMGAGFFWLVIMLLLTMSDYLTRQW